ncbi:MAG TPA: AAA family ATPase [Planctomycetota bacterium]|nr:AAA family ATPase [Planctomycetota bacterium]
MFFRRSLLADLLGPTSRNKVCLLFGARQTGKTALLRHVLEKSSAAQLYDLQDSALRRQFESDPARFGREVRALPKHTKAVVVDEIQKVPALLEEVQALYDAAPNRWRFYLTGSSARRLQAGAANLLPGRSHLFRLHPVTRWEEGIADLEVARPEASLPRGVRLPPAFAEQALERRLLFGSLPGVRSESVASATATLDTYVGNYVEEEVRREALVRDFGSFLVFLRLSALESGQVVNLAGLAQESGVPASTLKNHYQVLVDTFLGHWMPAFGHPSRKRVLSTPRFYWFDLGVRNAAAQLPPTRELLQSQGGRLLEHWVAQELIARASYLGRGHRVSFWRTVDGVEVDFVYEAPRADLPIEVKWTERPRPEDARHVERFLDRFPSRSKRGVLVCRCDRAQQLTDRVTAIPWSAL